MLGNPTTAMAAALPEQASLSRWCLSALQGPAFHAPQGSLIPSRPPSAVAPSRSLGCPGCNLAGSRYARVALGGGGYALSENKVVVRPCLCFLTTTRHLASRISPSDVVHCCTTAKLEIPVQLRVVRFIQVKRRHSEVNTRLSHGLITVPWHTSVTELCMQRNHISKVKSSN